MSYTATAFYAPYFVDWQVNVLGPKPSADLLDKVHGLGLKPGKQALACAMSLRDCGVTGGQIVIACGAPQLNRMRGLIGDGMFKRHLVADSAAGHTVYKNTVTPKGEAEIKRLAKVNANLIANSKPAVKAAKLSKRANKAAGDTKAHQVGTAAVEAAMTMPELPASLKRDKPQANV